MSSLFISDSVQEASCGRKSEDEVSDRSPSRSLSRVDTGVEQDEDSISPVLETRREYGGEPVGFRNDIQSSNRGYDYRNRSDMFHKVHHDGKGQLRGFGEQHHVMGSGGRPVQSYDSAMDAMDVSDHDVEMHDDMNSSNYDSLTSPTYNTNQRGDMGGLGRMAYQREPDTVKDRNFRTEFNASYPVRNPAAEPEAYGYQSNPRRFTSRESYAAANNSGVVDKPTRGMIKGTLETGNDSMALFLPYTQSQSQASTSVTSHSEIDDSAGEDVDLPLPGRPHPAMDPRKSRKVYHVPGAGKFAPSKDSGYIIGGPGINKPVEFKNVDGVSDASLLKRGLTRVGESTMTKRATGANDPENICIVNMYENEHKSWVEISAALNQERVNTGRQPTHTPNSVHNRFNRNAPILFAAEGKEFVAIKDRKADRAGEQTFWDADLDNVLVDVVKIVDASKWKSVARLFNLRTGSNISSSAAAHRHQLI